MLIRFLLLPAGLHNTRDLTFHGDFTKFAATQAEFTEHTTRAAGDGATVALAHRAGVARQALKLQAGLETLFIREAGVVDDGEKLFTLGSVFGDELGALLFTVNQCKCCHVLNP
ncbi:hypothetical protein AVW16_12600 [Crenobacter luteus]|uniref:Uncharacterized protein n=1 Tax=Crenobacter luteus TaxID=1452487 RepID=A0A163C5J2_9NEIS|nr:hypothetical protein AVW16_12600 [Crenobacter luteus]